MLYYLSGGDVTKWEPVLNTNAILCFTHLAYERHDKKLAQTIKR